jgi:hypothetical protein
VKLLVSLWLAVLLCGGTGNSQLFNDAPGTPAEKEIDSAQMRQIWKALMAYVADKGQTPDYLSDLVPEYLPDKSVLVSPAHRRTGKNAQMQEFGEVVPILRCFLYPKVLNVGYGGDVYETELYWESAPATQELLKQHGLGTGFKEGEFCRLTVEDAVSGKPIANCEVKLTNRVYHGLDLPNRVLTTDDEGVAQVPLGPGDHSMRRVQITATAPGYEKKMEMWTSNSFKEEATLRLKTADQRDRVPASPAAPEPKP